MKRFDFKKVSLLIVLILLLIAGIAWINKDLFHFESIHLTGRSFAEDENVPRLYRLTSPEVLKKGVYTIEFLVSSPSPEEHYVLMEGDEILTEGVFGGPFEFKVEKSSRQITAGVFYSGNNPSFSVEEINYYSDHVLTRDSFLYHMTLSVLFTLLLCWLGFRMLFPDTFRAGPGRILTPERERVLLFLLLLTALVCIPFYRPEYVKGDDSTYHMARIEGLKSTLEKGIFPPRIYLFYLNGYGYPGGIFYPDLMLYFPAVLRLLGFNFILTYKIFIFVLNFLNILSIYICVSRITGKRLSGLTAAVLFGLNAYRLINVFYRGAVGELQAFIFIPVIVLGLYYIFTGKTNRWWVLTFGCTGLVLSHLISSVLCGIMMFLFFLVNYKKVFRPGPVFTALFKSILISVGLCAYFILPLAEQFLTNEVITSHTHSDGIPLYALFANQTIWEVPVKPYPGYPLLFGCFVFLLPDKKPFANRKTVQYAVIFALLGFFCSTSLFPWKYFPRFHLSIQFPWRFFIISIPLLIIAVTITFDNRFDGQEQKLFFGLISVFCVLSAVPIYQSAFTRWMEARGYTMQNNRTGSNMYLPVGFELEFVDKNRDTVLSSDPGFITLSHKRGNLSFSFEFEVQENDVEFEIPLLYYTGYQAELRSGTTVQELKTYRGPNGFVSVRVSGVNSGAVTTHYVKTLMQHAGDGLTCLTICTCILFSLWKKRKAANG